MNSRSTDKKMLLVAGLGIIAWRTFLHGHTAGLGYPDLKEEGHSKHFSIYFSVVGRFLKPLRASRSKRRVFHTDCCLKNLYIKCLIKYYNMAAKKPKCTVSINVHCVVSNDNRSF